MESYILFWDAMGILMRYTLPDDLYIYKEYIIVVHPCPPKMFKRLYLRWTYKDWEIRKKFKYKDYKCYVVWYRNHYCGYIKLPKNSPFIGFGREIDAGRIRVDIEDEYISNVEIHGGFTLMGRLPLIKGYLLGFDCAHVGDWIDYPDLFPDREPGPEDTVWTTNMVAKTLKQAVDQIVRIIK